MSAKQAVETVGLNFSVAETLLFAIEIQQVVPRPTVEFPAILKALLFVPVSLARHRLLVSLR